MKAAKEARRIPPAAPLPGLEPPAPAVQMDLFTGPGTQDTGALVDWMVQHLPKQNTQEVQP